MTTHHGAVDVRGVDPLQLADEFVSSDNVEGGDAKNGVGVVLAGLLEHFAGNGNRGVDGVGDDGDHGVGANLSGGLAQVGHNGSVGVEEVVACHARFSGHAGRDDDNL